MRQTRRGEPKLWDRLVKRKKKDCKAKGNDKREEWPKSCQSQKNQKRISALSRRKGPGSKESMIPKEISWEKPGQTSKLGE